MFFRACSLLNKVGDPPFFFYISDITNWSTFNGKIFRKKSMLENFRAIVLKQVCYSLCIHVWYFCCKQSPEHSIFISFFFFYFHTRFNSVISPFLRMHEIICYQTAKFFPVFFIFRIWTVYVKIRSLIRVFFSYSSTSVVFPFTAFDVSPRGRHNVLEVFAEDVVGMQESKE